MRACLLLPLLAALEVYPQGTAEIRLDESEASSGPDTLRDEDDAEPAREPERLGEEAEAAPPRSPAGRIVLMPSLGCSGEALLQDTALRLLEAHGEASFDPCGHGGAAFLQAAKGRGKCLEEAYCRDADGVKVHWPANPIHRLETALDLMNGKTTCASLPEAWSTDRPRVLLISGYADEVYEAAAVALLARDPRNAVAGTVRRNDLRQYVCKVAEGWDADAGRGYRVRADGTRTRLDDAGAKLYLDPGKLKSHLQQKHEEPFPFKRLRETLTKHGYRTDFVAYEDLAASAYDAAALPTSLAAWTTLLLRAGVEVQPALVEAELRRGAGARAEPPLRDLVANLDAVRTALTRKAVPWEVPGPSPAFRAMLDAPF